MQERNTRKDDDFLCKGHILNAFSDLMYKGHRTIETAKELWVAMDNKYRIEETSNQKFLIGNYFDYKMVDSNSVISKVHELQAIVNNLKIAEINLPEALQVGAIIVKLPTSWNGYKKKLKHVEINYTFDTLMRHLRIEEYS